jgi:hypothetical protein
MESEEGSGCTSPGNPYVWYEVVNSSLPPGLTMSRSGSSSPASRRPRLLPVLGVESRPDRGARRAGLVASSRIGPRSRVQHLRRSRPRDHERLDRAWKCGPAVQREAHCAAGFEPESSHRVRRAGDLVARIGSIASGVLVLSSAGVLSGTPTAEGSWQFEIAAQNGGHSDTATFAISVRQPLVVTSPSPRRLDRPPRSAFASDSAATVHRRERLVHLVSVLGLAADRTHARSGQGHDRRNAECRRHVQVRADGESTQRDARHRPTRP